MTKPESALADALFDASAMPVSFNSSGSIIAQYGVPPFSVLDTKQSYWQDRRRWWIGKGIKSEIGRDEKLTFGKFNQDYQSKALAEWEALTPEERTSEKGRTLAKSVGLDPHTVDRYGAGTTSIFDPVLTEVHYKWYCPYRGTILDPFAGGSVRGIVAGALGMRYVGIELRNEQVEANREQVVEIFRPGVQDMNGGDIIEPTWINGDSNKVLDVERDPNTDFIFTCPPYADLEVYSDDPADLSKMSADDFDRAYHDILVKACKRLKNNRFAVIVIGNIRHAKSGHVRSLTRLTEDAMAAGGCALYNEAYLLNSAGTAALRVRKQFDASRKIVRTHQPVLTFVRGDARKACEELNESPYYKRQQDADDDE